MYMNFNGKKIQRIYEYKVYLTIGGKLMGYTFLRHSKIFMNTHVNTSIIQWPADNEVHRRENLCISQSVYSINWIICTHSGISISCITPPPYVHMVNCGEKEEGLEIRPGQNFSQHDSGGAYIGRMSPPAVLVMWFGNIYHLFSRERWTCSCLIICILPATVPAKSVRGAR